MKSSKVSAWSRLLGLAVALAITAWPASSQVGRQLRTAIHEGRLVAANEVLVKFLDDTSLEEIAVEMDAEESRPLGPGKERTLRLRSKSKNTTALIASLRHRADVEYVEPNFVVRAGAPSDTYFNLQWGFVNTGQSVGGVAGVQGADISADVAWETTTGNRSKVVGVVDTGIDYNHPDLAANVWSAPASFSVTVGAQRISCPAGSHGFNAINWTCDPADNNNHGTHVSGTIGAVGNNAQGVAGVNWVASIMGLKFLDANGQGTTADAIDAIDFAIQARQALGSGAPIAVLSNSWGGGGYSQALLDAVNRANQAGMLFVASAGNSGTNNDTSPSYPASYAADNVVSVAATDNRDALASFSNYGTNSVDLGAPGVNIVSTIRNAGYGYSSGTSMAAPHVSGAAALVLAACGDLGTAALKDAILSSVDGVTSLASRTATGGRLNVAKAVATCAAPLPPPTEPPPSPPPVADFNLSASPSSITVRRGASSSIVVSAAPTGGFAGSISLSASTTAQATVSPLPATVIAGGNTQLLVTVAANAKRGKFVVTITGAGGGLTRTTTAGLQVK